MKIFDFIFYNWSKSLKIPNTSLFHLTDSKKVNVGDRIVFDEGHDFSPRSLIAHALKAEGKKMMFKIVENNLDGWRITPSEKAARRLGVSEDQRTWSRTRPLTAVVESVQETPLVDVALLKKEEE